MGFNTFSVTQLEKSCKSQSSDVLLPSSGKNEAGLKLCIVNSITCCQAIKQNKVCGMLARSTDRGRSRQKEQHMVKAWGKEARGLAWNDDGCIGFGETWEQVQEIGK